MVRLAFEIAAAAVVLSGWIETRAAQSVQPCPDPNSCVRIAIGSGTGLPGDVVRVALSFVQGPDDGHPGGIDEIATLALTLSLAANGTRTPLVLADCTLDAHGLPDAIKPDASLSAFKVVVQNATCSGGQQHCLCPDPVSGITPDPFINLVIYGPPATPAPGSDAPQIPTLPSGQLLTIDLKIRPATSGTIPLHVLTAWSDSERPPSTAFVSAGDGLAADQTCVPAAGVRPCSGAAAASQLSIADGAVGFVMPTSSMTPTGTPTGTPTSTVPSTVTPSKTPTWSATVTAAPSATQTPTPEPSPTPTAESTATVTASPISTPTLPTPTPTPTCVGNCNGDRWVSVDELLMMVNIALGTAAPGTCVAGDANGDGQVTVDEILAAVNNSLNGCSGALRAHQGPSYRRERRKVDGLVRLLRTLRGGALPG